MASSLIILGRQPALGRAELESLYGTEHVQPAGTAAVLVTADVDFRRLGGAIKLADPVGTVDSPDWRKLEQFLGSQLPDIVHTMPEGKVQLGISTYGVSVSPQQILATGLTLKKALRKLGRSARLIPNKETALSSAQTLHNHLTGPTGCELAIVQSQGKLLVGRVKDVQDIESYTLRDRGRPKRDPRVGMLPPKLAQIIVNLAISGPTANATILDPFCGTGVVLQEALLMGSSAYGTDIEPRMVEYSRQNLDWLVSKFQIPNSSFQLEPGDATTHQWQPPINSVACETYLGRPFTSPPSPEVLAQTVSECNTIIKKFLRNIHGQLAPGTRLCLAVPAWQTRPGQFKRLPLVDQIEDLGYNRVSFEHVRSDELLYYREDQIVARELLVITRK